MIKRASQNTTEFTADFALHLECLSAIVCGHHHVKQMPLPGRDSGANFFDNIVVKRHFASRCWGTHSADINIVPRTSPLAHARASELGTFLAN